MDLAPRARIVLRVLFAGAAALNRGVSWTARNAWVHRAVLNAIFVRAAWWGSLWLAVQTTGNLLDTRVTLAVDPSLMRFGVGLGLCWLVVVLATAPRLRRAAIALGAVHGGLGLVLWTLAGGG